MKNCKTEFRFFSVADWEKEQDYLRKRHQEGWRLSRVGGLGVYRFERCVPEDVVYQLDYNPDGVEHKEEYVQMFRDCGWEYLQDYVGFSYFRKPASEMKDGEGIFCDEASRKDMMMRVFKGRVRPMIAIFLLLILPGLSLGWPIDSDAGDVVVRILWGAATLLYVAVFLAFAAQYWKIKK